MASLVKTSFHPAKKHTDPERWICIYPAYIDAQKTRAEGRRVPISKAVTQPTVKEILQVLDLQFKNMGFERKFYSRDGSKEEEKCGRVRVQLKNEDGSLVNPAFPNRDSVFLHVGAKIGDLKTRQNKSGTDQQTTSSGGAASAGGKKKNKGGRR